MTTFQLFLSIAGSLIGVGIALIAIVSYVFHNALRTHVKPKLDDAMNAVKDNTRETSGLTAQLATTNETQIRGQHETREAFSGIHKILTDHEVRISVSESDIDSLKKKPLPRIRKSGGG